MRILQRLAATRCGRGRLCATGAAWELVIEQDVADMVARLPVTRGAALDRVGRPALGADCKGLNVSWVKPLSDPLGGTDRAHGRHPAKMYEPVPPAGAPDYVVQLIHGSFANTSPAVRVTINFGFHRRRSVLGVTSGGVHNEVAVYDDTRIRERSRLIAYAIDARRQRFPDETAYRYQPFAGEEAQYRWTPDARAAIKDYNLLDLGI